MPPDRDRQSTSAESSGSFSHSFGPYEPSQPFPPLVEDPEPLQSGIYSNDRVTCGEFDEEDQDEEEEDDDGELDPEDELDSRSHSDSFSSASESDEASDQEEEGGHGIGLHPPFFRSSSSLHGPNAFAPPFYNRPPTPLPPSPSLTSLLRPSFSATTSRPSTPDSSDVETPNDTEAAVAKSARNATAVPRASPKVPTYEYYGFVLYLASSLTFRTF
jgi:phosphatidylinositol glycan class P protein